MQHLRFLHARAYVRVFTANGAHVLVSLALPVGTCRRRRRRESNVRFVPVLYRSFIQLCELTAVFISPHLELNL